MATQYAPGDPNTPSHLRTKASGWSGSRYVGTGAPVAPAPAGPAPPPGTPGTPSGAPRAVEGFDMGKLADPTQGTTHKYVGGRVLQAGGGVDQILADPKFAGWTKAGDDKIRSPQGSVYDTSRDHTGSNGQAGASVAQWTYVGGGPKGVRNDGIVGNDPHSANYTKPGGLGYKGGGAGGGAVAGTLPNPVSTTTPGSAGQGDTWNQLYNTLLERSNQGLAVDRNNPVIRQQADAYSANEERAKRNYLNDMAERQGPLANMGGEARLAAERVGQRTGGFEAELMGRELTAKRDEIQQALTQQGAMLTEQKRQALQMQLAKMDDAIRRYQIQTQDSQFGRGLAQSESEFGRTRADGTADRNNYWDAVRSGLI